MKEDAVAGVMLSEETTPTAPIVNVWFAAVWLPRMVVPPLIWLLKNAAVSAETPPIPFPAPNRVALLTGAFVAKFDATGDTQVAQQAPK